LVTGGSARVLRYFLVEDFVSFSNLKRCFFDENFPIQEVSTGSFVITQSQIKKALENLVLDLGKMNEWLHVRQNGS
jgi:trans-2,3-dihydro-3-hydroxyanthranilate isomerase